MGSRHHTGCGARGINVRSNVELIGSITMHGYRVTRHETGALVTMADGTTQPETYARIFDGDEYVTQVRLNATTFCAPQPYGAGVGTNATDEQIILAVLGDEHIFTGAPVNPEHHHRINSLGVI